MIADGKAGGRIDLAKKSFPDVHQVKVYPFDTPTVRKTEILKAAASAAKAQSELISQVKGSLGEVDRNIMIMNSEGFFAEDRHIRTRIYISAVASRNGENQIGSSSPGRSMGLEMFELFPPEQVGITAAKQALVNLNAGYIKAGRMTVAIENGFGGVIFHEACGHSPQATQVGIGMSECAEK